MLDSRTTAPLLAAVLLLFATNCLVDSTDVRHDREPIRTETTQLVRESTELAPSVSFEGPGLLRGRLVVSVDREKTCWRKKTEVARLVRVTERTVDWQPGRLAAGLEGRAYPGWRDHGGATATLSGLGGGVSAAGEFLVSVANTFRVLERREALEKTHRETEKESYTCGTQPASGIEVTVDLEQGENEEDSLHAGFPKRPTRTDADPLRSRTNNEGRVDFPLYGLTKTADGEVRLRDFHVEVGNKKLDSEASGALPDEMGRVEEGLLAALCGEEYVTEGGWCGGCPTYTRGDGYGDKQLPSSVTTFESGDSRYLLATFAKHCETHRALGGGTVAVRQTDSGWERVDYARGVLLDHCLPIDDSSDNLLVCHHSWMHGGFVMENVIEIRLRDGGFERRSLLGTYSNLGGGCRLAASDGELVNESIETVEYSEREEELSINIEAVRVPLPAEMTAEECSESYDTSMELDTHEISLTYPLDDGELQRPAEVNDKGNLQSVPETSWEEVVGE